MTFEIPSSSNESFQATTFWRDIARVLVTEMGSEPVYDRRPALDRGRRELGLLRVGAEETGQPYRRSARCDDCRVSPLAFEGLVCRLVYGLRRLARAGLDLEATDQVALGIHYRTVELGPLPLDPEQLFQVANPSFIRIPGAQRNLDLALADDLSQAVRNALSEKEDSAFRMPLRGAEREDHLCTDVVYRRRPEKPL